MVCIGVLGASGYTRSEAVRLLANHPHFCITLLTADRKVGQSIGSVFPQLITQAHAAIRADPSAVKSTKEAPKVHNKRYNLKKLTYEERKAKLIQRLNALNETGGGDDEDEDDDE